MMAPSQHGILLFFAWWIFASCTLTAQSPAEPSIHRGLGARIHGEPVIQSGLISQSGPAMQTAVRTAVATSSRPIPLKSSVDREDARVNAPRSPWAATLSMLISLAMVVSLFLIAALMIRKSQPRQFQKLPREVVEVIGRSPLGPRQQLVVLRFGSKLILVSQQAGETTSLGEIVDATEADRLVGLCEASRPESISNSFRDVFRNVVQAK